MLNVIMSATSNGGLLAHWYEIAGIIIAVPAAVAIVWGVFKAVSHMQGVHEAIVGRPATSYSEEVPSMIARFKVTDAGVTAATEMARAAAEMAADTFGELHPNGGASFRDSLDRNEQITTNTGVEVGELARRVDAHIIDDTKIWNELREHHMAVFAHGQDAAARDRVDVASTAVRVAADVAQTTLDTAAALAETES